MDKSFLESTENFMAKSVGFKTEVKPEQEDKSLLVEDKTSAIIKFETSKNDCVNEVPNNLDSSSSQIENTCCVSPSVDRKLDDLKTEIQKKNIKEEFAELFGKEHNKNVFQETKIEIVEHSLKKESDISNIEKKVKREKRETLLEGEENFKKVVVIINRMCFDQKLIKTECIESPDRQLNSKQEKRKIITLYKGNRLYDCDKCDYKTTNRNYLKWHAQIQHPIEIYSTCQICDKKFKTKQLLNAHIVAVHSENETMMNSVTSTIYKCDSCDYKTTLNGRYRRHVQLHEDEKTEKFLCDFCGHKTFTKKELTTHLSRCHHTTEFYCHQCNRIFKEKIILESHIVSIHPENEELMNRVTHKVYNCNVCEYKSINVCKLKNHQERHNVLNGIKVEKPFQCDMCNYKSRHKNGLKVHRLIHVSERPFPCEVCDDKFITQKRLDNHIVSQHSEIQEAMNGIISKIYECDNCDYKTIEISRLNRHSKTHEPVKEETHYQCDVCGYKSLQKSSLKTHIMIHTGFFPFCCQECNKNFKIKRDLDSHILREHSKNKTMMSSITSKVFSCAKCKYKTVTHTSFKFHVQRHKAVSYADRKFECYLCGHRTLEKSALRAHIRLHIGLLPYKCDKCDRRFSAKAKIDAHIVSIHSKDKTMMNTVTAKIHYCKGCKYKTCRSGDLKDHRRYCRK